MWGVVLIVAGVITTVGPLLSFAIGPRMVDANLTQMKVGLQQLPVGEGAGHLTAENKTKIMTKIDEIGQEIHRMLKSPVIQIATLLKAVFGAMALAAGIGILLLQGWARHLVIFQACGSMVLGLWELSISPQRQIAERFVSALSDLVPPAAIVSLHDTMVTGQSIGLGVGFALLLAWNGVVIWFFNRQSVKAQFLHG